MITLSGVRKPCSGGAATKNLVKQIPLIANEFPEIAAVHRGTINLHLEKGLLVLTPDYRTNSIPWGDIFGEQGEVFDFLRIGLEAPEGNPAIPAWIYIAHGSAHRNTFCVHEIIAPFVNLNGQAKCRIHISRRCIELPYHQAPVVVVV
jgi:hypothetical protein